MNIADLDPFCDEFLGDPFPFHEQLREAGPAVWLERYRVWALARHEHVVAALDDWETFCSSAGVGLSDFRREKPWRPPSLILEADPPLHTRTRNVMARILSRPALEKLRAPFTEAAEELLAGLPAAGIIDAATAVAQAYPLRVFPDALGLKVKERDNLLPYANMVFNTFGPRNKLFEESVADAARVVEWINAQCRREALDDQGFGAQIYAAADAGHITHDEAPLLVRSLLTAGMDTTVHGLGHALNCLARNPDQWQLLRDNPRLARGAFEESVRLESPVQTFFRTTTRAVDVGGIRMEEGQKVLLFLAAANRDPRYWSEPDHFDINRQTAGHTGFGHGIHMCVGQMVARLEGEVLLGVLARRFQALEPAGEPVIRLNNTLRGLSSLPLRFRATA